MNLDYRPPVYMWIAEYSGGSALPQFDPETGKENLFRDVDQSKLKRFGWYPFATELSAKIYEKTGAVTVPTSNSSYMIELKNGDKLVAKRENILITFNYHYCTECGFAWQFTKTELNVKVGLQTSSKAFVEDISVRNEKRICIIKFVSPICPNCGYHDCNAIPKDKKRILKFTGEKRETAYVLGVEGKKILHIHEDGNVEVK